MRKSLSIALRSWIEVSTHHAMRGWAQHARAIGLSMPQFSILMALYHRGDCGISDISDRFGISNAAASQHVDNLVHAGLLDRAEDPHDRRAKHVQVSEKGRTLIQRGFSARFRWADALAGAIDPKQHDRLAEALDILAEATRKLDQAS